jgi:hypothetical protein
VIRYRSSNGTDRQVNTSWDDDGNAVQHIDAAGVDVLDTATLRTTSAAIHCSV